jgi:thiol-disulfide isomerase/thioredoxin
VFSASLWFKPEDKAKNPQYWNVAPLSGRLIYGFLWKGSEMTHKMARRGGMGGLFRRQVQNAVGLRAPELIGGPDDFLNTNKRILRLGGESGLLRLKGPVLIDFWEYTCVNCIRTLPYLKEWHQRYADLGLTIVGIHTPEFAFAKAKQNVADAVTKFGLTYPILVDSQYANWNAWSNNFWPRKFLVDRNGVVVYDHAGEGNYGNTEAAIQKLLRAQNPGVRLPRPMEAVRGSDKPGAVCYPATPEIYCGYWRGPNFFGSPEGATRDAPADYTLAKRIDPMAGAYSVRGRWQMNEQSIRHARKTERPLDDVVVVPYGALEINAVIKSEDNKPFDLYVLQDGKPLTPDTKTMDTQFTADGQSFIRITEPRMYHLAKNRRWGKHELTLGTTSDAFGLYSFTFASCVVNGSS